MAKNGNNILVYVGSSLIAGVKSDNIQTSVDLIEIASPTTGQWRQYIPGRKECTITVNYLVLINSALGASGTNPNAVRDLLQIGNSFNLVFKDRGATDNYGVSGTYILKSVTITSTRGSLVQGSFQFQSSGALS